MRALAVGVVGLLALVACGEDAPSGPPRLAYGTPTTVEVDTASGRVPVSATVRLVQQGSPQALAEGGLSTLDLSGKTPFYVRVSYVNTTGYAFTAPLQQQFRPRQDDGAYATRLDIVSDEPFEPCDDPAPPVSFGLTGGAADACLVVLAEEGRTITSVEWTFADRTTDAVWVPPGTA